MHRSLILSQTRPLGGAMTKESLTRGFPTTLVGNAAGPLSKDRALEGAVFRPTDLADPYALPRTMCGCWERVTHVFIVATPFLPKRLVDQSVEDLRFIMDTDVVGPIAAAAAFHRLRLQAKPLADEPGAPYHLTVIVDSSSWRSARSMAVQAAAQASLAHFARNFGSELLNELPGSKMTLFHLRNPRSGETAEGIDPADAAARIWDTVLAQEPKYMEYHVARNHEGPLRLEIGALQPEYPDYPRRS